MEIDINLSNGLYTLPELGGVGKTYLFELLQAQSIDDKSIACYTYDYHHDEISNDFTYHNERILIFDRMDLYVTKELLSSLSSLRNCIILCDLKLGCVKNKYPFKYTNMYLESGKIVVEDA